MPLIIDEQNTKIDTGSWVEFKDSHFLIASSSSLKFLRTMARLQKPYKRKIERNEMDPGDQQKILIQAISESVLLDWKGVQNSTGNEVPYSKDLGAQALKNDPEFREFVMEISSDLANFKQEESEHEGNS